MTKLIKGKTALTAIIKPSEYCNACDSDNIPMAFASKSTSKNIYYAHYYQNIDWILDSGATDYMSSDNSLFTSLELLNTHISLFTYLMVLL